MTQIIIKETGIKIGNILIEFPTSVESLVSALGLSRPDTISTPVYHMLLWNSQGIYAYQNKKTKSIDCIGFQFHRSSESDINNRPTGFFRGSIILNNTIIDTFFSKQKCIENSFSSDFEKEWNFSIGNLSTFIEVDQETDKVTEVEVRITSDEKIKMSLLSRLRLKWIIFKRILRASGV